MFDLNNKPGMRSNISKHTMTTNTTTAASAATAAAAVIITTELDNPDTEEEIHRLNSILARVPKCMAWFKPDAALSEATFEPYFPRTLDAARWTFGMSKALRIDVTRERMAKLWVVFETEVATYISRIRALVAAPKSAFGIVLPDASRACVEYLNEAIADAESDLRAQEARIAALLKDLGDAWIQQFDMNVNMAKTKRALCAASALEEAAEAAAAYDNDAGSGGCGCGASSCSKRARLV